MFQIFFILSIWLCYMFYTGQWHLFINHWQMSLVMLGGSFTAGASPESGGAFAFPVMSLLYHIPPDLIRNFSLIIQSVGMTLASFYIYKKRISIDRYYLLLSTIGGAIGITLGTLLFRDFSSPDYIKMLFFSFWLSFAFVLFYINHIKKRHVNNSLPDLNRYKKSVLIFMALIGGILTSILGSGIDIFTFSYVTMRYNLSEKVATPTSIIIMTVTSIYGFILRILLYNDIGVTELNLLKVCIPVVIFGAPLGVYTLTKIKRMQIANLLYVVLLAQFVAAWAVIRPEGKLLIFSIVVFLCGIIIFSFIGNVILFGVVLKKIFVPEKFSGRTFAWDKNNTVGFDIGLGFWNNIFNQKKIFIILFGIWIVALLLFTNGNTFILLKSPIPIILIVISIIASLIANSTAAGGGIIFLPIFSFIFVRWLHRIDITDSYFAEQTYTLFGIVIAIHVTQAFGMLSGSLSWWRSGVKILIKENLFNIFGAILGIIIGKYFIISEELVYRAFGIINLLMSCIIIYKLFIVKNIPINTHWPGKLSWIFFFVGIVGGLLSAWTSIGIGGLTSFILILILKPEIGIANGSFIMAVTSIVTVVVHIILNQPIPVEIILFTIPAVLFGGYAAPFFGMWVGRHFYRLLIKFESIITYDIQYNVKKEVLEYTSGQLIMTITFILVCLLNGIYYIF
ncbi:MAG: sulfite exporter TauE/SafE family protein [Spirochaetota bacterium]|nr:sulfite exporter TauE/SafE family protein [Spirochaetota bacterium]